MSPEPDVAPRVLPRDAWLTGRETYEGSRELGEVVAPSINIWTAPGSLASGSQSMGRLPDAARVQVLREQYDQSDRVRYYEVSAQGVTGWVAEAFLSWRWSCFVFSGKLAPAAACAELQVSLTHAGMSFVAAQDSVAVTTDGNPAHFGAIRNAATRYLDRLVAAQALHTAIPLTVAITQWVEVPLAPGEDRRTVGFVGQDDEAMARPIPVQAFEAAHGYTLLLTSFPYLDLAIQDWYQALRYPAHAPIFLARAVESVENHFYGAAARQKGIGKTELMQQTLGISRADVDYITRRANDSHRRHASTEGSARPLPPEELVACHGKTRDIIFALIGYLRQTTGL